MKRQYFPKRAMRKDLEVLGARYLVTDSYTTEDGSKTKIEYMVYEDEKKVVVWKREGPRSCIESLCNEQPYTMHFQARITKKYSD